MSAHDRDDLDPEDLVARARRGLLSRAEHEELARALEKSPELATAYRVGTEIDRASAVQGGDDALIARSADAAIARVAEMTSRTRVASLRPARMARTARTAGGGSRMLAAAVVLLSAICASGVAAALWSGAVAWPFKREASTESTAPLPEKKPAKRKRARPEQAAPVVEAAPSTMLERAEVIEPAANAARPQRIRKHDAAPAAVLFSDANAARRSGDLMRARRLYADLIEDHPSSDEAGVARVSLGKLLLAAGEAQAAEREFRRYLAAGHGQLAEEALVGQAQSLQRLRREGDERQAWQRLLSSHPSSVYAAQARQRLAALDEGQP